MALANSNRVPRPSTYADNLLKHSNDWGWHTSSKCFHTYIYAVKTIFRNLKAVNTAAIDFTLD